MATVIFVAGLTIALIYLVAGLRSPARRPSAGVAGVG
jgi:hypothetical protein